MAHDPTSTQRGFSRRAFLTAGGAVVGSAVLLKSNPAERHSSLGALAARRGPQASVGYIAGTEGMSPAEVQALLAEGGARVTPATRLRSGVASYRDGNASVRIDGTPLGLDSSRVGRAQVDALLSPRGMRSDEPVPYFAWTFDPAAKAPASSGVSFAVPFDRAPSFGIAVRTKPAGAGAETAWSESTLVFTGGADRGMAKMRPGAYLVGLERDTWASSRTLPAADDPRWASLASLVLSVVPN